MASSESTLLVIDVQQAFDNPRWGKRNNEGCEGNIARILETWRRAGHSVIHVHHQSEGQDGLFSFGQPGFQVMAFAEPIAA
jgi:nicotinamidase-related amidase